MARTTDRLKSIGFWIASLVGAIGTPALILLGFSEAGWATLICSLMFMLACRFETVVEIAFGPFRARLREKVEETEDVLRELRSLAVALSEPVMTIGVRLGRWDTALTRAERLKLYNRMKSALTRTGVDPSVLESVMAEHHDYVLYDLVTELNGKLVEQYVDPKVKERRAEVDAFKNPITDNTAHSLAIERWRSWETEKSRLRDVAKFENVRTYPVNLRGYLGRCPLFSQDEREAILSAIDEDLKDIEYYIDNLELRRPEAWLSTTV